jgi:hypothetical protein
VPLDKSQYSNARKDNPSVIIAFTQTKIKKGDLNDLAYQLCHHIPNQEAYDILKELMRTKNIGQLTVIRSEILDYIGYGDDDVTQIRHLNELLKIMTPKKKQARRRRR